MTDITTVIIRDPAEIAAVVVHEPTTSVVVSAVGLQGPRGVPGDSGNSGPATDSTLGVVEISGTPSDVAHPVVYVTEQTDALVAVEASSRASADTTLQTNITAEASARASAVSAEATSRAAADTTLQANIDAEATTRAAADANLQPKDATLTALAALDSSAGLLEETGADTFAKRAIGVGASSSIPTRADADARYAAAAHTHAESDVTGLVADLAAKQPLDTELTALAGLTSAADKGIQFTGAGTAGTFDLTAAGRALIDDANAAAQRATLGVVIGTDVEAHDATLTALAALDSSAGLIEETALDTFTKRAIGVAASTSIPTRADADARYQALDSELTALAGLTSAADALPYFTGSGAAATATFTAVARTLIAAATVAAQRVALGLVIGTDVQAYDAELAALAGLVSAADKLPYFTGSGAAALADLTSVARTLLAASTAAAQRSAIGLVIGTDVQAYDAELAALAGLTSAADKLPYFTGSGTAALADLTSAARTVLDDASTSAMLTTLGAIAKAIGTAKGDLIGFSASATPVNLAVGANDTVPAADSGASGGLSYQYVARQLITTGITAWYATQRITVTTATPSTGEMYASPITIPKAVTFVRIAIEVTTGGSAGAVARLGIYNDDGNGQPGTLVLDAGTVATTGTGAKEITISQALGPGIYWLAVVSQVAGSTAYRASNNPTLLFMPINTGASFAPNTITSCWKVTGVSGALPSPYGTPVVSASAPIVGLKAP